MYDITYCATRVAGGLVTRDLKIEDRHTMIAMDKFGVLTACSIVLYCVSIN